MGTVITIPASQTIKPNLVFGGSVPESGYIQNQHENDNFIRKNALNAEKFNEYERLLFVVCNKLGQLSGTSFGQSDGTVGGAIGKLDSRLATIEAETGVQKPTTAFHTWLFGGNVFYDPDYTRGENIEQKARGFFIEVINESTPTYPDHHINVHGGTAMVGTSKGNVKYIEFDNTISFPLVSPEFGAIQDLDPDISLAVMQALPNSGGDEKLVTSKEVYLDHKYLKTGYFSTLGVTVLAKIEDQTPGTTPYTEGTQFTIDYENGKLNLSDAFYSIASGKTVSFWYSWYKYRRDIVYLDSEYDQETGSLQTSRRGLSYDTFEEVLANNTYTLNTDNPVDQYVIDPLSESFRSTQTFMYEIFVFPWNAISEELLSHYRPLSYEDNVVDHRTDAAQSVVKWRAQTDGVLYAPDHFIYADVDSNGGGNLLRVNVAPHTCIVDGRVVRSTGATFDLDTGASSINNRIVALCVKYDGEVTAVASSSAATAYPVIPDLPDYIEGADTYTYDGYIGFIHIPAGAEHFDECFVYINKVSRFKSWHIDSESEANLISALYDKGIISHYEISPDVLDEVNKTILLKELNGETGRQYSDISLTNYIRLKYIESESIPGNITTITSSKTDTTYKGAHTGTITIEAGLTLEVIEDLQLDERLSLEDRAAVITLNNKSIIYAGTNALIYSQNTTSPYIDAKIDANNQADGTNAETDNVIHWASVGYGYIKTNISNVSKSNGIDMTLAVGNIIEPHIDLACTSPLPGLSNVTVRAASIYALPTLTNASNVSFEGYINGTYKILTYGAIDWAVAGNIIQTGNVDRTGTVTQAGNYTGTAGIFNWDGSHVEIDSTADFNNTVDFYDTVTLVDLISEIIYADDIVVNAGGTLRFADDASNYFHYRTDISDVTAEDHAGIYYTGYFGASRVYNAWWNDVADFQPAVVLGEPGKVYAIGDDGYLWRCRERCQSGVTGICTDTYGIGVGEKKGKPEIPIAVSGFVLAYVKEAYEPGTPLVNDKDGNLVKATIFERLFYSHRIVATYQRVENAETWGPENEEIIVNNRHWVKVR